MAELKQVLTNRDMKSMFDITKTTIYNWRRDVTDEEGNVTKKGLPFFKLAGNGLSDPVRYRLADVEQFCKDTGRAIINPVFLS